MTLTKKFIFPLCVLTLVLICVFICSCEKSLFYEDVPPKDNIITFTDSTGAEVTLEKKPERVAVLFSSFAEIWQLAGGEVITTVGETVERGFASENAVLVDSGAGHSVIDVEALIASEPDFVVGTADYAGQVEAVEICRKSGIPAALFRVETFEDYLSMLSVFCEITHCEDRYETYGEAVKMRVEKAKEKASLLAEKAGEPPSILFLRAGSSDRSTKAKTAEDNFVCSMLSELGCKNVAEKNGALIGELSLEAVIEENPSYLFITTMGNELAATEHMQTMLAKEGWRELDCVKSGSYYFLPRELFHFKPNARWDEAYEYLISILYPEAN